MNRLCSEIQRVCLLLALRKQCCPGETSRKHRGLELRESNGCFHLVRQKSQRLLAAAQISQTFGKDSAAVKTDRLNPGTASGDNPR